jgi:hypothetical protein
MGLINQSLDGVLQNNRCLFDSSAYDTSLSRPKFEPEQQRMASAQATFLKNSHCRFPATTYMVNAIVLCQQYFIHTLQWSWLHLPCLAKKGS